MNNKVIKGIVALMLVVALPVVALCGQKEAEIKIDKIIDFYAFGTGSTTGTYFPLGTAFSHVWTQRSKRINVMTVSTNGSYENIELLRKHEVNLAIAQSDTVNAALKGTGDFEGRAFPDLKVLMALYPEVIQIVAPKDSSINSVDDLKGRRVNVGPANSGNALTAIEVLKTLNIPDDSYTKVHLSYDEAIQAMEKNEIDATIIIAGVPTKAVSELKRRMPIKIVNIPLLTVAETVAKLPYLSAYTLSNSVYGDENSTSTLAVMALLISNKDLETDRAYELTKILFDNLEYLKVIHERARDISLKNAFRGIERENINNYLHPGSAKYLAEKTATLNGESK